MSTEDHSFPATTTSERVLDYCATAVSVAPWLGGPVAQVLSGMSVGRKFQRVGQVLEALSQEVKSLKEESAKKYVETEEFQDLLEETLRRAGLERSETKRKAYARLLARDVQFPKAPYDEKLRLVRTIEALQEDHFSLIRALLSPPSSHQKYALTSTIMRTLQDRLPGWPEDKIHDLITQLEDLRIVSVLGSGLHTMMTIRGAQDLGDRFTPFGKRLIEYVGVVD